MSKSHRLAAYAVLVVLGSLLVLGCNNLLGADAASLSSADSRDVVTLSNPGFESDFTGWTETEPSAISTSDVHGGSKSAKLSGLNAAVSRTVSGLTANTTYSLKAWILGEGVIGANSYGGSETTSGGNYSSWTQLTVTFTTGASNTSAVIFARDTKSSSDVRFDDFTLESGSAPTASPTPTATPTATATATATPTPTSTSGSTPVKLSVSSVSASSDDGNVPANTIDGSLSTRWSGENDGTWIEWDLGSSATISYAKIAFHNGSTRTSNFDLVVYNASHASPVTVLSGAQSSGSTTALETFDFADTQGRYLRYVGHGNSYNNWNSLTEAEVWGIAGASTPTPTTSPTPTPTATSSSSPTPTASPTATPTGTITAPGQLFNLINWKETLPVDTTGDGKADEIVYSKTAYSGNNNNILNASIATYVNSPWFTLNPDKTAIQFRAHHGGVTTSGSGNPRSELRELKDNGVNNASWSSTSGTHTLFIRQKVTHLTTTKPHVVVGQIHDADDDVTVFRFEGNNPGGVSTDGKLWITNGDTTHGYLVDSSLGVGEEFTVKIIVTGGVISYEYNGQTLPYTQSKNVSGCYFKVGCYTQSNPGTASDDNNAYAEVYVYDFAVTHS